MDYDALARRVRRTLADVDRGSATDEAIEVLFVDDRAVWIVLDPDGTDAAGDETLIEVFGAVTGVSGVETVRVERLDVAAGQRR